jgi:hypothetical protein
LTCLAWETLPVANDIINDMKKLKIKIGLAASRIAINGNYMMRRPKHSKNEVVAPKEEGLIRSTCPIKILYTCHTVHAAWHFLSSSLILSF